MRKVKWGILGAAKIARQRVIPAMQKGDLCEVTAIASRDPDKAQAAADELDIPKAYGSYEEMLADPEIEAVYNPLPNHPVSYTHLIDLRAQVGRQVVKRVGRDDDDRDYQRCGG